MSKFLWGVYPYLCAVLFFVVPVIRMSFRPFGWSTRATSLFANRSLGVASLFMHWGLVIVLAGHLAGLFGGLLGSGGAVGFFYWSALIGGFMVLIGSSVALVRRIVVPEVRAMSQPEDYIIHLLLIPIVGLALYQVLVDRIFGIAYTASSWIASLWTLNPQPELMDSASLITKLHVFLALTFFAYFPFTKLVHFWTYPINYFVRPYQSMRTARYRFQRRWEWMLLSDKSWLTYGLLLVAVGFLISGLMLGKTTSPSNAIASAAVPTGVGSISADDLNGYALYVSQCARCHGLKGAGDGPGAGSPTFAQPPRNFVEGQYRFISTINGVASDDDLARTIRDGLVPAGMPAFPMLSDTQVTSLVRVVRGFAASPPPPAQPISAPTRPSQIDLAMGQQLFATNCAACHGAGGRGDGAAAGGLPIPPRDLTHTGNYKAGASPEQIYDRIAAGVPPYMPPQHGNLNPNEIWAIVSYVESLQQKP